MSEALKLSQCGQYFTLNLSEEWDSEHLRLIVFQARALQAAHGISKIQIQTKQWLSHTLSIEHILSIGEILARLPGRIVEQNWKITIITPQNNEQNITLENILSLKDIEVKHFEDLEKAQVWLLER